MNESAIAMLNERFGIVAKAQLIAGNGGLPKIQINTPAATAEIYLHGAQVTSWKPSGAGEVLFLSKQSRWEDGRAIRGGIPVCFPWFRAKADNPQAPAHGVVRTREWRLEALEEEGDGVTCTLATESDEASRRWWPYEFKIVHCISVGAELKLALTVTNTGSAEKAEPMRFEEALHTYHLVGDAAKVHVAGLDEITYLDNMASNRARVQQGDLFYTQPTDNAYLATVQAVELIDPLLHRRIRTTKGNSLTTVVWNPWREGAAALADLGDTEWQQMACAEASNILDYAATVAPGEQHTMSAVLAVIGEHD